MKNEINSDAERFDLHIAAIIALLSSFSIKGVTAVGASVLRAHLETVALSQTTLMHPHLRQILEDTMAEWLSIECLDTSVSGNLQIMRCKCSALH